VIVDVVLCPVNPNNFLSFGQQNSIVSSNHISDHLGDQVIGLIVEVDFANVAIKTLLASYLAHALIIADVNPLDVIRRRIVRQKKW
jgi:hypothetical protein